MPDDPRDSSRLRQALRQAEQRRDQHVDTILNERGPVVRGTFRLQGGRCGKPGCKCARGELHGKAALYVSEQGKLHCSYVPLADRERLERLNRRYQRVRQARAALAKLGQETLKLADAIQSTLTEPYPPPGRAKKPPTRGSRRRPDKGSSS